MTELEQNRIFDISYEMRGSRQRSSPRAPQLVLDIDDLRIELVLFGVLRPPE